MQTDRRRYRANDNVVLTVDAYDDDYQPLSEEELEKRGLDRRFTAELILPRSYYQSHSESTDGDSDSNSPVVQTLSVTQLRRGTFEVEFPVLAEGEHRVRVMDPITKQWVATTFTVAGLAVERHSVVRDVALQEQLAREVPGGETYDLTTVGELPDRICLTQKQIVNTQIVPLWFTWLFFGLIVGLLLCEWLLRKRVNLL